MFEEFLVGDGNVDLSKMTVEELRARYAPNDPKLSDRRARRGCCVVGLLGALAVTCAPVRCCAWLGDWFIKVSVMVGWLSVIAFWGVVAFGLSYGALLCIRRSITWLKVQPQIGVIIGRVFGHR